MSIGICDNCDRTAPGHVSMSSCGEGFFCYTCRGDSNPDPYGELEGFLHCPHGDCQARAACQVEKYCPVARSS